MLLREVEYARPASVGEALRLLSENEGARALAGGQTLINVMKARAASPDALVDLNGLDELKGIDLGSDGIVSIGAMVTYSELRSRPWLRRHRLDRRNGHLLGADRLGGGPRSADSRRGL